MATSYGDVRSAVLTAALGLAEEAPDSVFAGAVSLAVDGNRVSIAVEEGDRRLVARDVSSAEVSCNEAFIAIYQMRRHRGAALVAIPVPIEEEA